MLPPFPTECLQLTLEQQFQMQAARVQLENATPETMRDLLLTLMPQLLIKENVIKFLISNHGGCEI
jgi:hypothetical protein